MAGRVALDREGPLARVTLSHPGKLNAMSRGMWRQLREVFTRLQADADCRCVLLAGAGGAFCAGGDIAEYPEFRFEPGTLRDFHEEEVWGGLQAVIDCDVPVVAQIDGACMGAGLEIASACDIRLAGADSTFGAPIAKLGFPMAPREAALVASVAGAATARELLLEAAVLGAAEMKARGFVHEVLPQAQLAARAQARCERIMALAPAAARLNKQTLRALAAQPSAAAPHAPYDYAAHPEHREGITAFLEKRKPAF
jgi:enoyl-CoA hydratase/carnithine racemase